MGTVPYPRLPVEARHLFWCWVLNEPVIIDFIKDKAHCGCCDRHDVGGEFYSDGFLADHTFMTKVSKPGREGGGR